MTNGGAENCAPSESTYARSGGARCEFSAVVLAYLKGVNPRTDIRRKRRALGSQELLVLIETSRDAPAFRGLSGLDRSMLYAIAAYTGLRAGELSSLTGGSFSLVLQRHF